MLHFKQALEIRDSICEEIEKNVSFDGYKMSGRAENGIIFSDENGNHFILKTDVKLVSLEDTLINRNTEEKRKAKEKRDREEI